MSQVLGTFKACHPVSTQVVAAKSDKFFGYRHSNTSAFAMFELVQGHQFALAKEDVLK